MATYEVLLYLATEPYEKKIKLSNDLNTSDAILNALKEEFNVSPINCKIDTRQASETMVYK